jgi:hypothetical protein
MRCFSWYYIETAYTWDVQPAVGLPSTLVSQYSVCELLVCCLHCTFNFKNGVLHLPRHSQSHQATKGHSLDNVNRIQQIYELVSQVKVQKIRSRVVTISLNIDELSGNMASYI